MADVVIFDEMGEKNKKRAERRARRYAGRHASARTAKSLPSDDLCKASAAARRMARQKRGEDEVAVLPNPPKTLEAYADEYIDRMREAYLAECRSETSRLREEAEVAVFFEDGDDENRSSAFAEAMEAFEEVFEAASSYGCRQMPRYEELDGGDPAAWARDPDQKTATERTLWRGNHLVAS